MECSIVLPYQVYEILHLREAIAHDAFLLFAMTIGIFGTVLLTANRSLAIILPLRYTLLMTTSKSCFVVAITWFIKFAHSTVFYVAVYCQNCVRMVGILNICTGLSWASPHESQFFQKQLAQKLAEKR